jgi:hypothetical protein
VDEIQEKEEEEKKKRSLMFLPRIHTEKKINKWGTVVDDN